MTEHVLDHYQAVPFVKASKEPIHMNTIAHCSCGWTSEEYVEMPQAQRAWRTHVDDATQADYELIQAHLAVVGARTTAARLDPFDPTVVIYSGNRYVSAPALLAALLGEGDVL